MEYVLSPHAQDQIKKRKLSESLVQQVLLNPQQIIPAKRGRMAYQSIITRGNKQFVLRVFVIELTRPAIVVSVYYSDRVGRYWQEERKKNEDAL